MKDHFLETAYRLREMRRFTIRQVNKGASVADHAYFVSVLALYVSMMSKKKYRKGDLLAKALLHDTTEAITSDVPYFIKHHSSPIEEMFKGIDETIVKTVLTAHLTDDQTREVKSYVSDAKDGTPEGKLVALCDLLEAQWYLTEERLRGNILPWVDEVYQQLMDMIYSINRDGLKEPAVTDISEHLAESFGPIKKIYWSDIMGGGYKGDKRVFKKTHPKGDKRTNATKKNTIKYSSTK